MYNHNESKIQGASHPGALTASIQPDVSPIEKKLQELHKTLECAHEGMDLLSAKLSPVRAVCPVGESGCPATASEACEVEQRLQYLIDSASSLSRRLSDLRGELRI